MKVKTIEQYKVLQFLKDNFNSKYLTMELESNNAIKVTDRNLQQMIFYYQNGEVVYTDVDNRIKED